MNLTFVGQWTRRLTSFAFPILAALLFAACAGNDPDQRLAVAKAQHAKGDVGAAILELKSSLQETPEHGESRLFLGSLYSETGDYRSAEKEYRRAIDARVDAARVLPALGQAIVLQGDPKRALNELAAEPGRNPELEASVLATRGMAYLALRQPADARAAFDQALALKPDHVDARAGSARLIAGEGKIDAALEELQKGLNASPKAVEGLMLKGDLLRAAGRIDESKAAYEAVVGIQPGHVNALLALVSLAIASGNLDEASTRLAAVRKAAPGHAMGSYFQALIDFRKGDFKSARDAIGSVLRVAPGHLPSLLIGGAVEFALGSHELAQTRLKHVLDRTPSNAYARRLLIASYARAGQTHKAMELLEPMLKQGTKDPAVLALAGEVHMQLNEYGKAQAYFEQAAALAPDNPAMRTGLGLSRLAAGDVELATADLQSASALDTSKYHADVLLISTLLRRGQYAQALKAAHALESKQPNNPLTYNLLAAAYLGSKDAGAARRALEKALSLQPGYTPAAVNLAQLDLQDGNKAAARKRFEDMIARDRSNVQAYIALASLAPQIDATAKETEQWLEAARREGPGTIQPLVMLARFHFRAGDPKKALEVLEKALAADPDNIEVLNLTGQAQLAAGEVNRALGTFSKWVTVQPSPMAFYRVATAQMAGNDSVAASASLRKALQQRPSFPEAQALLAEAETVRGDRKGALAIAASLQKEHQRSALGWTLEGDIRLRSREYEQAVTAYEAAFSRERTGSLVTKLHAALAALGRDRDADTRVQEWLRSNASDDATRLYLADHFVRSGKWRDAITQYESVLSRRPDNVVAVNNLSWCYQNVGDERALEFARRAHGLKPDSPAVLDTLGWILVQQGDARQGLDFLKKAANLAPRSSDIRVHYVQGLANAKEDYRAKQELERLILDFPEAQRDKQVVALQQSLGGRTQ